MNKSVYISAARAICAQDTFVENELPEQLADAHNNALEYQLPDFSKYFSIMQLRRMSRLMRTGLVTAMECLADAGIRKPEAIITGTGKGSISDTEKFLQNIREFEEGTLNPTPFIQSTYNSLNGLISVHQDTSCYNTTFVHRGHSLELAITDAILLIQEGAVNNALVGSFEEISDEHYILKQKLGYWKNETISCSDLLASETPGTISGEGSFFFVLQNDPLAALARLNGLRLLFEPDIAQITGAIQLLLGEHNLEIRDIDLVFLGNNGDARFDAVYGEVAELFPAEVNLQVFKPACGEFETASGFALWLAIRTIMQQTLHPALIARAGTKKVFRNILVYNHYNGQQHAIYLLQKA